MTKVVNLYKEPYNVYIGRAGKGKDGYFGNPYRLQPGQSPVPILEEFRKYFYDRLHNDAVFKERVHQLKGKVLGCFCKPKPCHGDIIAEYVDSL